MLRNILVAVAAIVVAFIISTLIQAAGYYVFPPAIAFDPYDPHAIEQYMKSFSQALFGIVLAGYAAGSLAAGYIIGKFSTSRKTAAAVIVGAVLTLRWVASIAVFPHPLWIAIIGFLMFIPFVVLGCSLASGSGGTEGGTEVVDEREPASDVEGPASPGIVEAAEGTQEAVVDEGSASAEGAAEDSEE